MYIIQNFIHFFNKINTVSLNISQVYYFFQYNHLNNNNKKEKEKYYDNNTSYHINPQFILNSYESTGVLHTACSEFTFFPQDK